MKISIVVTTKNEFDYIEPLFRKLKKILDKEPDKFEVVIFDDYSDDNRVIELIDEYSDVFTIAYHHLNNDFASHKNEILQYCKGDWIFQLDADEDFPDSLIDSLHDIVDINKDVEMYWVPRINTVEGLTEEHIKKWNWKVNEKGYVMWPDFQNRLYKRDEKIRWINKVHERLVGYDVCSSFPPEEEYAIIHKKDIKRQELQNEFYDTLKR